MIQFIIWYLIGLFSILPLFIYDTKNSGKLTIGDILCLIIISLFGPITAICTLTTNLEYIITLIEKINSITIWKRK